MDKIILSKCYTLIRWDNPLGAVIIKKSDPIIAIDFNIMLKALDEC